MPVVSAAHTWRAWGVRSGISRTLEQVTCAPHACLLGELVPPAWSSAWRGLGPSGVLVYRWPEGGGAPHSHRQFVSHPALNFSGFPCYPGQILNHIPFHALQGPTVPHTHRLPPWSHLRPLLPCSLAVWPSGGSSAHICLRAFALAEHSVELTLL